MLNTIVNLSPVSLLTFYISCIFSFSLFPSGFPPTRNTVHIGVKSFTPGLRLLVGLSRSVWPAVRQPRLPASCMASTNLKMTLEDTLFLCLPFFRDADAKRHGNQPRDSRANSSSHGRSPLPHRLSHSPFLCCLLYIILP